MAMSGRVFRHFPASAPLLHWCTWPWHFSTGTLGRPWLALRELLWLVLVATLIHRPSSIHAATQLF
eukprot:scaffold12241_cov107-Isochrysis_galbana.AAC.2